MGKIKVKTLGTDEEALEIKDAKKKSEIKKEKKTHISGMGGGERVVSVGPTEEELEKLDEKAKQEKNEASEGPREKSAKKKQKNEKKKIRSKKYQSLSTVIEEGKAYSISDGLELLEKLKREKFDETVELHLNTASVGINGSITLPHGSGKKTRIAIATDELIAQIEKGKIEFDILVSAPEFMGKLAKVAKVLGPRGLMPNPKNGTITDKPEELVKKYEGGQVSFKTESKSPIIHLSVGKISFGSKKLIENIDVIISAIKKENIQNATLKSTMSPGIKLSL